MHSCTMTSQRIICVIAFILLLHVELSASLFHRYLITQPILHKKSCCSRQQSLHATAKHAKPPPTLFPKGEEDPEEKAIRESFLLKAESPEGNEKWKWVIPIVLAAFATAVATIGQQVDITALLDTAVEKVAELGPMGYFVFAAVYIFAELFAIPAMPLTASSGYLFGLIPGTLVVITSATIAASISFLIGRTYLRTWAQSFIQSDEKWRAIDRAIQREGFKVILLLRLSPLLPFALSNYLYAVTSVDFVSFITATFLGFTPGTFGYVYFGSAGKEIFSGEGLSLPWYVYLGGGLLVLLIAQTIGQIATNAIKDMDREDDQASPFDS